MVPQRGAATAVLQAHVVVGVAAEACLVLHSLVPHADAAGGASADSFPIHATRPGPHANTIAPLAPQRGTPHRQARVLKGKKKNRGNLRECGVGFMWAWALTWSRRATHAVPLLLGSLLLLLLQEPFGFLLHLQQSQSRRLSRFGEPGGGSPGPA